jgi:hypothetical protein
MEKEAHYMDKVGSKYNLKLHEHSLNTCQYWYTESLPIFPVQYYASCTPSVMMDQSQCRSIDLYSTDERDRNENTKGKGK